MLWKHSIMVSCRLALASQTAAVLLMTTIYPTSTKQVTGTGQLSAANQVTMGCLRYLEQPCFYSLEVLYWYASVKYHLYQLRARPSVIFWLYLFGKQTRALINQLLCWDDSQGCVKHGRWCNKAFDVCYLQWSLYCKFTAGYIIERILKIGLYLMK